jgi:aryl-alcohol dehydrogenase-like predicted oxidoreductase
VEQLERALTVTPVVSVQNHYNLDVRAESDPVVDWCEARGIAFMAYRPIAGGKLESDAARRVAEQREVTPSQVALAWLLHRSPVMLPIPGTSSMDHLRENTAAAELELAPDEMEALAEG